MSWGRKLLIIVAAVLLAAMLYCYVNYGNCLFFARFIYEPAQTGSITPTSRIAAKELLQPMLAQKAPRRILEIGAGTGPVTEVLVDYLQPEDTFDVLEIDAALCKLLQEKFQQKLQVHIHCLAAQEYEPEEEYDIIVSTVPLTNLSVDQLADILQSFERLAKPGATLSYLEYIGGSEVKSWFASKQDREAMQKKVAMLDDFRAKHKTETETVMANVPPTYVHHVTMVK